MSLLGWLAYLIVGLLNIRLNNWLDRKPRGSEAKDIKELVPLGGTFISIKTVTYTSPVAGFKTDLSFYPKFIPLAFDKASI